MIKNTTKKKTVEYESQDVVCDLCETEVPAGQAMITLVPSIEDGGRRGMCGEAHKIDVCSVDCLVKNAGAAGLLLNTKILPDLRSLLPDKKKKSDMDGLLEIFDDMTKKAAYDDFDKYKKYAK